jgi:GNAT superfamily N-acetyltransferase
MFDLTARSERAVTNSYMRRTKEAAFIVRETPSRPGYWYGHGFEVLQSPNDAQLAALAADGVAKFGAIAGTERFVILDEAPAGALPVRATLPPNTVVQRDSVHVHDRGPDAATAVRDAAVLPVAGDAEWSTLADLLVADASPDQEAFHRWLAGTWHADVEAGSAHVVGIRDAGRLVAYAGLYDAPDEPLARFITPVTHPSYRKRGYFSACARALLADAYARGVRTIVICAAPDSPQERLYRALGFRHVADRDAFIVNVRP